MKILYTRRLDDYVNNQDYLCDSVFYGLSQLPNVEITDAPRLWYMYKNEFTPNGPHNLSSLYGRGFTVWGLMDESNVDRSNIEQNIQNHYYDLVILSRVDHVSPYIDLILENYKPNEIVTLDGLDETEIFNFFTNASTYFKRELLDSGGAKVLPISFGIPDEKCRLTPQIKTQTFSRSVPVIPGQGYIFDNQDEYHDDYAKSLFGITHKKAGWDCMRHYEILANRCIPYFTDINDLPDNICKTLPKELLKYAKARVDKQGPEYFLPGNPGWQEYQDLEEEIHARFMMHGPASKVAEYILKNI
jgi:hypothetical protein